MSRQKQNPEKALELSIVEYLERGLGLYVVKIPTGKVMIKKGPMMFWMQLAREGTPDLHFIYKGKPCYTEVKTPASRYRWEREWNRYVERKVETKSNRRSIMQHLEHQRIARKGGIVFVCSSIEELERELAKVQ